MASQPDAARIEIHGHTEAGFKALRIAFEKNFQGGEVGASFAVTCEGRALVDLWAGHADRARTMPWRHDTLANVWSTTKGISSLCCAMLVDRGELDYDEAVAHYWPEFDAHGKGNVTVAMLLSHQAGLSGPREPVEWLDYCDTEKINELLLAQEPLFEPGSASGYHATTFGPLVGGLFRRATGRSIGSFLHDEITRPLAADFFIGLPESEEHRVAEMIGYDIGAPPVEFVNDIQRCALANPAADPEISNQRAWRAAEIPSVNGHASAAGIAKIYGALANDGVLNGTRLLSPETLAKATALRHKGIDHVFMLPFEWGAGFIRNAHKVLYGPNPNAFGHTGYGGSFGFADPERRIGVGYVMNKMGASLIGDRRGANLIRALDACF
ncbi:MAG: beta-lactamase family protein [Deltaproteobacteria bacterium]|nr:beta-lactamase family protein [Deltaproteobacteria bacterium]MBW2400496.1 beta-lactamase family protein [Deltaproteobacteria bacterium]